jgi:hypothetical protein
VTRALVLAGWAAVLATHGAVAQRLSADAAVHAAEHRVNAGFGLEETRGPLFSAALRVMVVQRVNVRAEVTTGSLTVDNTAGADHDVSALRGILGFQVTDWLTLDAGAGTRVFTAPIASQRWTTTLLGAELRVPFAHKLFEATGMFAWLPTVSVTDIPETSPGILASVGVGAQVGRFGLAVSYWLERYEFPPANGVVRNERLSALMFQASWRP